MQRMRMLLVLGAVAACGKGRDDAPTAAPPAATPRSAAVPPSAAAARPATPPPTGRLQPTTTAAATAPVVPVPADAAPADPALPVRASALTIELVEGIAEEGGDGVSVSLEVELLEDAVHPLPRVEMAIACRVGSSVERQSVAVVLRRAEHRRISHTFWQDEPLEEPPATCEAIAAFAEGNAKGRVGQPLQLGVACWSGGALTAAPCSPNLTPSFD